MADKKKKRRRRKDEPTDMGMRETHAPSPDDLIPHIPGTPEDIARTMFGKRFMPDGTLHYTEEGLRRVREKRANQQ